MGSSKDAETEQRDGQLWGISFKRLVPWTARKHRMNPADAEEVVQEAVRQFLEAGGKADPNDPRALLDALRSRVNGVTVNRRRKKADRAVRLTAGGGPEDLKGPPDSAPSAEERMVHGDVAHRTISALLERIDGDDLAMGVVMQMAEGVEDPAAQAKALGQNVVEVYKARKRLRPHLQAIRKLMEKW